jgi:molybdopterin-guanine dinucleotide biosynthesis protein A
MKGVDVIEPAAGAPKVHSLVLAGGASSRMGCDKSLLVYHGMPQAHYIAHLLEEVAPPAFVSVSDAQARMPAFGGLRLLRDPVEGIGPLAGLLAAFAAESSCAWLAVAVDLPWIGRPTLERLIAARDTGVYATCYRIPGTDLPEPVCALYEPRILPVLERAHEKRRYSLMLLRDVPIHLVEPAEERELRGVNDPSEYRAAQTRSPRA